MRRFYDEDEDDDNQAAVPGRRQNPALEVWSRLKSCCVRGLTRVGHEDVIQWRWLVVVYLSIVIFMEGAALRRLNRVNPSEFDYLRADWSTAGFVDVVVATSSCPAGYTVWGPKQTIPASPQSVLSRWKGVQLCVNSNGTSSMYDSPCWKGSCEDTITGIQFIKGAPPPGTPPERIFTHENTTYSIVTTKTPEHPPLIYFTLNIGSDGEYCRSMSPGSPVKPQGCSVERAGGPDHRYNLVDSYEGIANGGRLLYQENGFAAAAMEDHLNGLGSYAFVRPRTELTAVQTDRRSGTCNSRRFMSAIDSIVEVQPLLLTDVLLLVGLALVHFVVLKFFIEHMERSKWVALGYVGPLLVMHCISLWYVRVCYKKANFALDVLAQCRVVDGTPGNVDAIIRVPWMLLKAVFLRYTAELVAAVLWICVVIDAFTGRIIRFTII